MFRSASIIAIIGLQALTVSAQVITVESPQESLDSAINSRYFEESPVLMPDHSGIFFTRSGHPENMGGAQDEGDIWYAARDEQEGWTTPQNLGSPLNDKNRNVVMSLLNQGEAMLLTHQHMPRGADKGFAIALRKNDQWAKPQNVDVPYFKAQSNFKSATVSPDGNTVVFSLMTFGSYGVEDLYFTRRRGDGSWSDLRNLGSTINTRFQEMTPFIAPDGKTLYFSSNGHGGEGGLDIYVSVRQDDTWRNWSQPVNLGPQINTIGSETSFSFLPDSDWGVLVSTQNSDGYGDLKKVKISFPEDFEVQEDSVEVPIVVPVAAADSVVAAPVAEVEEVTTSNFSGTIVDAKTGRLIGGTLLLVSELDSLVLNSDSLKGFSSGLQAADYRLVVKSNAYLEYDTAFTLTSTASINQDFRLEPLEVGNTIRLRHVLFERGTTELVTGSEQDLEAVYHMLQDNPTVEIAITGHTDNQGNFKLNVKLSQERVDRVVAYLVDRGIDKKRLTSKGWGPMKPIASNATEESRRLNRRVEFTITKK